MGIQFLFPPVRLRLVNVENDSLVSSMEATCSNPHREEEEKISLTPKSPRYFKSASCPNNELIEQVIEHEKLIEANENDGDLQHVPREKRTSFRVKSNS